MIWNRDWNLEQLRKKLAKSGRGIKENGDVVNVVDRLDTIVNDERIGAITVTTAGIEAKIEDEKLENRHSLYIVNDSSALVYIGFDEVPTIGLITPIVAYSGEIISIRLDPRVPRSVFLITEEYDVPIRVVEVS